MRSNGLPGGHTDLNSGHQGLSENLFERILISKVPSTSLRPEMVKKETTENVQGLFGVCETASVISEEPGGVVVALSGSLPEEDEWLGDGDVLGRFPFVPDFLVSNPSALRHGTFQYAVL